MPSSSDFTGRGWAFPLHLDSAGSFALSGGEQEIEEAIRLILSTSFGERPLRPEYGCGIHDLVFNTVDGAGALTDSYTLRRAALMHKIAYYTTVAGARASVEGIAALSEGALDVAPLQSYFKTTF